MKKVEPSKEDLNKIISDQNKIKKAKLIGHKTRLFNEKFILPSKGRMSDSMEVNESLIPNQEGLMLE